MVGLDLEIEGLSGKQCLALKVLGDTTGTVGYPIGICVSLPVAVWRGWV